MLRPAPARADQRVCNVPHHCCAECNVAVADLPGAAHPMLVDEVVYLEPGPAVFGAMLEGWARQQRTRGLAADTVRGRAALVRRLYEFHIDYRWIFTVAITGLLAAATGLWTARRPEARASGSGDRVPPSLPQDSNHRRDTPAA
jgi:hypothetical protein